MAEDTPADVTSLTVQLLSAYLSNNTVESGDLAGLIATTRAALATPADVAPTASAETYEPAVSVRKSLASRDHIISMIDGKPYKMLKRHLLGHGLTPAEYRARYNLPADYPTVAPAYSDQRREVAKTLGLGRKSAQAEVAPSAAPVEADALPASDAPTTKPVPKAKATPKAKTAPKPELAAKPKAAAKTSAKAAPAPAPELAPATLVEAVIAADAPAPSSSTVKPKAVRTPKADAKATAAPVVTQDDAAASKQKASRPKSAPKSTPKSVVAKAPSVDAVVEPSPVGETAAEPAAKRSSKAKTVVPATTENVPPATEAGKPAKKRATKATNAEAPSSDAAAKPGRAKRMARAPKTDDEVPTDVTPEPVTTDL